MYIENLNTEPKVTVCYQAIADALLVNPKEQTSQKCW